MPMIYNKDNRENEWGPDPEREARQGNQREARQENTEEAAALEMHQRRQFSYVGFTASAFMLITLAAQLAAIALVNLLDPVLGDFIDFYGTTGRMLMSAIPMYLVAFPAAAGLVRLIPRCGAPEREQWGFSKFAACFVIAMGIGLAGNILGRLVGLFSPGGTDSADLENMLLNSNMWLNMLITVIMAPVVEELFFRKLIMDRLLGYGQKAAVIVSGLMFGMAHGNFSQFFYAFGIGVLWAYVYAKTGKIGYTIGFHMIFNLLGGIFAVELSKGVQGLSEGPWVLRQLEQLAGIDFNWLITAISSVLTLAYVMFMAACLIAAVTLLIVYRRRIVFCPGERPLGKGKAFRTVVLNMGMIVYVLVCCGLFALSW